MNRRNNLDKNFIIWFMADSRGVSGFDYRDEQIIEYAINQSYPYESSGDVDDLITDLVHDGVLPKGTIFDWNYYTVSLGNGKEYEYDFDMTFDSNLEEMKKLL